MSRDYAVFLSVATGPASDALALRFLAGESVPSATLTPRGIPVDVWVSTTSKAVVVHAKAFDTLTGSPRTATRRLPCDADRERLRDRLGRAIERAAFAVVRAISA